MLDKIRDLQSGTRKVDPVEKARVDKDLLTNTKLFKSRKMLVLASRYFSPALLFDF